MIEGKKICFLYFRPTFNEAKIKYMPFGYNFIFKLLEQENEVDLFLGQSKDEENDRFFDSEKVKIKYFENPTLWNCGVGRKQYFHFRTKVLPKIDFKEYDLIVGMGLIGIALAGMVNKKHQKKVVVLSDEYPNIYFSENWKNLHNVSVNKAHLVILPCIGRLEEFKLQCNWSNTCPTIELPNTITEKQAENITFDWENKLILDKICTYILFSGGKNDFNYFYESYLLGLFLPVGIKIIFVGGKQLIKKDKFLENKENLIWIEEEMIDSEYNGLISRVDYSLALYKDIACFDTVGKSSGKVMRSICLGTKVITNNFESMSFVKMDDLGIQLSKFSELVGELIKQKKNRIPKSIQQNYFYDHYWRKAKEINI